ncbi:hypothetical protein [Nocardia anaemiae]|uniref:hypothetical protein n=1 Tax=Nocardia anaemiae TaxID=263910 RepID=UPI0007A41FCB|nr:hypothetical protein [Nocardia anaemiae]
MNLGQRARQDKLHISDYPFADAQVLPEPSEADFAWARANPGKWQHFVDPRADKSAIGQSNVIGGWLADDKGGFAEIWLNPDFIPTPQYARRDIANEFELVMWRLEYGFNNIGRFIDAFSRSEFIVVLPTDDPEGRRGLPLRPVRDAMLLDVHTSAGMLLGDVNPWLRRMVAGREVLEQVCTQERTVVIVNPDGFPNAELRGSDLADWWQEWIVAESNGNATESDGG